MSLLNNFLNTKSPNLGTGFLGTQAKAPAVVPAKNTLPPNQTKTSAPIVKSSYDANVANTQKDLNTKYNAGLKVDGISGPLTKAAMQKYTTTKVDTGSKTGILPSLASQQQQKNTINPDTGVNANNSTTTPNYTPPNQGTTGINQGGIIGNLINQSNNPSPIVSQATTSLMGGDYAKRVQDAIDAQNRAVAINQELNQAINNQTKEAIPIEFQQGRQSALQRDYGVQAQAATQAAQNAAQIAGLTQAGLTSAGGLANTAQGQQISAGSSAGSLNQPTGNIINVSPVTGQPIAGNSLVDLAKLSGSISGIQSGAASNTQDYQKGLAPLRAADNIQSQIISTLQANPTLNNQPVSAITNLNEFLSGQSSQPGQQLLSQQVAQYINALGIDPNTAVNIAYQQQGTLAQLLDSLRQTAQNLNEAKNPNTQSISGSFQEGQSSSDGSLVYKGGKWVKA